MAPVKVDPKKVRAFKDAASFYKWLAKHHDKEDEVWIKIHKVDSGLKSINPKEAIDVVLCWGWIDGIAKGFDEKSYLQRFCPRGRKSVWSAINVGNVARLINEGRVDLSPVVTHTFPMLKAREAFELASDRKQAMKVLIDFAGAEAAA